MRMAMIVMSVHYVGTSTHCGCIANERALLLAQKAAVDIRLRFCSTLSMHVRLHKALLAFVLALSFVLNGGTMPLAHANASVAPPAAKMAHGVMPCDHAANVEKRHPCCPQRGSEKASCTADCCTSVTPAVVQAKTQFTFVIYKQRPKAALVLTSRVSDPPSRPPKV